MEMTTRPWPASEVLAEPAKEESVSVLFIEDDPSVAEMYRIKLEADGYRVTVIDESDLKTVPAPRGAPQLIFLDIRMPHRDRVQVLRRLRTNSATRGVPVVILSDYSRQDLSALGVRLRAAEYFVVSFATPVSLSPRLEAWTRMHELA